LIAAKRARNISMGAEPMLPDDNDKPTVIALREIADGLVGEDILQEAPPPPPPAPVEAIPDTVTGTVPGAVPYENNEQLRDNF